MPKRKKDRRVRVAMLGHKRVPSREGGVEIVVGELSARMVEMGYDVTCLNRRGHHVSGEKFDKGAEKVYRGVKLKSVLTIDKKGLAAVTASFFGAICAAFGRYDIVHFHAEGPCASMWIPKLFGKKCIATIHGLDHQRAKWGRFASWYIRTGEKCAVRFADSIIVLSESVKQYFSDTYGRKTVFIPNGVLPAKNREAKQIANEYGLFKDEYILYLGRLVPEKGIEYLIEAYKDIKSDKKLVIAGGNSDSGGYPEKLKKQAAGDKRIIFTGFVEGRILEELYSNAFIYVLPSDLEGMPLSLLEAMSYGNCCLTSDIPECADVIGEFGVTFKKSSVTDLRDRLCRLLENDDEVHIYKENAAEYICSRYNWDEVTRKTLQLYGVPEEESSDIIKDREYEGATR